MADAAPVTSTAPSTPSATPGGGSGGGGIPTSSAPSTSGQSGGLKNGTAGTPTTATPGGSAPPPSPKYYEVKVNNKMVRMTEQELVDRASMASAATERFQKASEIERKHNSFRESVKNDPIRALLDPELGLSKEQIREKLEDYYFNEYVEPEKLSPTERELKLERQKVKEYEEREQQRKSQIDQEQQERNHSQFRESAQKQIIDALESTDLLPKTDPYIVSRMAFYMRQNNINGYDAPMDAIVRQVHSDTKNLVGSICGKLSGEQLVNILPPEVVQTLLKHHLDKVRKGRNELQSSQPIDQIQAPRKSERLDMTDVDRRLRDMRTGKISW